MKKNSFVNSDEDVLLDDVEDEEENNELMGYDIAIFYNTYNLQTLIKWIEEKKLIVPSFQRSYIWKKEQASAFIDSLLRGLPVPSIFFYDDRDNKRMLVVDGQQRLLSLYKYISNKKFNGKEFELKGNSVHEKWRGKTYDNLSDEYKNQLIDTLLNITVMRQLGPDDGSTSMYLVFQRINTGGKSLTPQEVRMAVSYGELAKYIDEISNDVVFKKWSFLTTNEDKKNGNNSRIQEFLLKIFAYYFRYVDNNFVGSSLRSFLDQFFADEINFDKPLKRNKVIYHSKKEFELIFNIVKECVNSLEEKNFVTYDEKPVQSFAEAVLIGVVAHYINKKEKIRFDLIKKSIPKWKNEDKDFKRIFQPRRTSVMLVKDKVEMAVKYFEKALSA